MTVDGAQPADDAAVAWFVILNDEEVTDEQRRAFEVWRAADPKHARAWAELEHMWGALTLPPAAGITDARVPDPKEATAISRWPAAAARPDLQPRARSRWPAAIAASLLIAIGFGWQTLPDGVWSDHRTSIGERRIITLDDGSEVELGSASALNVHFSTDSRKVTLVTGEAFFNVAKDAERPFVVTADNGEIAALGTAFNIKIASNVSVTVTHSAVNVQAADQPPVRVVAGQGVSYDARTVSAVAPIDVDDALAWRHNQLIFRDARLEDVLAELQRFRHGYIQLLSSDLADRRVTAVFDARRPNAALESIAQSLDLHLYRATDLFIGIAAN